MSREEVRNVLGFWYHQELFTPPEPARRILDAERPEVFPWQREQEGQKAKSYRLYGGLASLKSLGGRFSGGLFSSPDDGERKTYLYTIAFDSQGRYIKGSIHLSYFAWAVSRLAEAEQNQSEPSLNPQYCEDLNHELDAELSLSDPQFTPAMLLALNRSLDMLLFGDEPVFDRLWYALEEDGRAEEDLQKQSLLLHELRRAAEFYDGRDDLSKFVSALRQSDMIEEADLSDPKEWKPYLQPSAYAPARWPDKDFPSLSRQCMINRIHSEFGRGRIKFFQAPRSSRRENVIGNVLASQVYKRAEYLAGFAKPSDAFTMRRFQYPPNDYSGNYYVPFLQLSNLELLASAENADVLNELAAGLLDPNFVNRSHSHSESFDLKKHKEVYFTSAAKDFCGGNPWGLIAVCLEDERQLLDLVTRLIEEISPKAASWQSLAGSEDRLLSWEEAKTRFVRLREKVRTKSENMSQIYRQSEEVAAIESERDDISERLAGFNQRIEEQREIYQTSLDKAAVARSHHEGRLADLQSCQKDMHGFLKFIYKLFGIGPYAKEIKNLRRKAEESESLAEAAEAAAEAEAKRLKDQELKAALLDKQLKLKEKMIDEKRPSTELMRAALGPNYVDHRFYRDLDSPESQAACPWMDHELAGLGERMFKASLDLMKSFCVHANEVLQNLRRLKLMLEGGFADEDRDEAMPYLLHTLRLIIPLNLMPRTFLERLEKSGGKAEGGTLLYLDPEKTRPQDLVGPFWRSLRSFCFGDCRKLPAGTRPPHPVDEALASGFGVDRRYLNPAFSSADYLMAAEGRAYVLGRQKFPFPLRYSFGQDRLLFDLDNQLCLNNLLLGTPAESLKSPDDFLEASSWLDIEGEAEEGGPFIRFQADILSDMLAAYVEKHNKLPDVGIACFFPEVYRGFRLYVKENWFKDESLFASLFTPDEIQAWLDSHCFMLSSRKARAQNELVFLSGVGEKDAEHYLEAFFRDSRPLHSLLSSAKERLLIIASREVWASRPPMDRVYAALNRDESPERLNKKTLVFLRAGRSELNEEHYLLGRGDSPLSKEGREELSFMASVEGRYPVTDRYYTSGLRRARESMEILFPDVRETFEKSAFNEVMVKELKASNMAERETVKLMRRWLAGEEIEEEIESRKAVEERVSQAVSELLDELERLSLSSATIITHQVILKTLYAEVFPEQDEKEFVFCPGGGFILDYHRLGKAWKAGKAELLCEGSIASDEAGCIKFIREMMAERAESEKAVTSAEAAESTADEGEDEGEAEQNKTAEGAAPEGIPADGAKAKNEAADAEGAAEQAGGSREKERPKDVDPLPESEAGETAPGPKPQLRPSRVKGLKPLSEPPENLKLAPKRLGKTGTRKQISLSDLSGEQAEDQEKKQ